MDNGEENFSVVISTPLGSVAPTDEPRTPKRPEPTNTQCYRYQLHNQPSSSHQLRSKCKCDTGGIIAYNRIGFERLQNKTNYIPFMVYETEAGESWPLQVDQLKVFAHSKQAAVQHVDTVTGSEYQRSYDSAGIEEPGVSSFNSFRLASLPELSFPDTSTVGSSVGCYGTNKVTGQPLHRDSQDIKVRLASRPQKS